jgi:hypothetical protein
VRKQATRERFLTTTLTRELEPPLVFLLTIMIQSIIDVYQLIRELVIDVTAMPQYANEFIAIMDSILVRYFDKCISKMDSELRDVLTGTKHIPPPTTLLHRLPPPTTTLHHLTRLTPPNTA